MRRMTLPATLLFLLTVTLQSASAADNQLTEKEKEKGWVLLFNGNDYTGWKCNNGKPVASPVEDGSLVPYKSGGYVLIHEKQFGDFLFASAFAVAVFAFK